MPEEKAAHVAAASDADFRRVLSEAAAEEAAGNSDDQEAGFALLEDTRPVVEEETPTKPEVPAEETPETEAPATPQEEHNPNATLEETEEKPDVKVEEQSNDPQFVKDAKNLAKKWDNLSDGERLDKVKNLAKARPNTFKALAAELGTSTDLLLSQHELDSTDYGAPEEIPEFNAEEIAKKAEEAAYQRLKKEQGTDTAESENNRFVTEVSNYAKHNKIDAATQEKLASFSGEVFKKFQSLKYDPTTGGELSVKKRIALSLEGNKDVQDALIASGVLERSTRVLHGVNQALPPVGKASKPHGTDLNSIATASDADFKKAMSGVSTNGVVPLEF